MGTSVVKVAVQGLRLRVHGLFDVLGPLSCRVSGGVEGLAFR